MSDGAGDVKGAEPQPLPVLDPIDVLRAALAAKGQMRFVDGGRDGARDVMGAAPATLPVQDPIDVFRAALAERAKWQKRFVDAGLVRDEIEALLHTIEGARGREDLAKRENKRALGLLLKGRADWFAGLLRNPAAITPELRAALAALATGASR